MIINALNSGAKTFMADLEDSTAPSWKNTITGQQNLIDANKKQISLIDTKRNKSYTLNEETAVLLVRPRGLHLDERHLINNEVASGSWLTLACMYSIILKQCFKMELHLIFYLQN
jgi:malate synthase